MMRVLWCLLAVSVAANSAQAQLRLPVAPLPPLPLQRLTQTVGQTGANALDQLSEVRHLQIAGLIRANPRSIAADPHGNPVVRDELLAFSATAQAIDAAQARGFRLMREQTVGELDFHLAVLQPPPHMSIAKALRWLREADPAGAYDYNHIYMGVGAVAEKLAPQPIQNRTAASEEAGGTLRPLPRVGLVDAGVEVSHPVFHDAIIHTWGCNEHLIASTHGTAVASLLVGQAPPFHGVLVKAELYAADVYCNAPTGGAVDALAAAFAWLAQQRVAVINVSLVGPDNAALAQIVRALTAHGFLLVAAVGNDGPAAPPLYPASYPNVVGVTAVDAHRRVLIEAAHGKQVMFAAPGADMAAADMGGKYVSVRGTSFAAPIVAALLAQTLHKPDPGSSGAAIDSLSRSAIDLGPPGHDLTYGFGLVGADYRTDPAELRR
ncbi:MAG TPA: S8 family serine peptidase [Steroidobacteraceae bacterium]|jgi:hypothetical protein